MQKGFFKSNFTLTVIFAISFIAFAGCKLKNNSSQKEIIIEEPVIVKKPLKDENKDESSKQETIVLPGGSNIGRVSQGEVKKGEVIQSEEKGIIVSLGDPGKDHSTSTKAYFSKDFPSYISPLIYIKDGSDELLIAEKNEIQTLYGFSGDKTLASPLPTIPFWFHKSETIYAKVNVVPFSENQPSFCKHLNAIVTNKGLLISIKNDHEKLTSLTTCSFRLEHKSIKFPPHQFAFNFSYTFKDWKAHTAAVDVNHTINILEKIGINEETKKLTLDNKEIKDITPVLGLVNLENVELRNNKVTKLWGLSVLRNLQTLTAVNEKNLTDMPNLTKLRKLYYLKLIGLHLKQIPDFSKLHSLQNLDLSNNLLTTVTGLSNLTELRSINLTNNQLTSVPGLSNLTNLEILYLGINHLTEVPDLPNSNKLKVLYINHNKIEHIPHEKLSWIKNNIKDNHLESNPGFPNFGN